jgi:glyoxylase-like metal-dependent hydrolase (beta-lactamase superfamily II)
MTVTESFNIQEFFDAETFTLTYVVWDELTKDSVIIDSVLDYDHSSGNYSTRQADQLLVYIKENKLNVHYLLETHAHADHLTASVYLKEKLPHAKVGIGKNITLVQEVFKGVFNLDIKADGSQFDHLFEEDEIVHAGSLSFKVLFTPGHTPACTSLLFDGVVFTGDALFMPDYGTGRCDFPKGSAEDLFVSISEKLYSLPDNTAVYTGHDYQPGGRELQFRSTIGTSKKENIRLKQNTSREDFIKFRSERDATLSAPHLLLPSIQVNIDAGHLPKADNNGVSYLRIPLTKK